MNLLNLFNLLFKNDVAKRLMNKHTTDGGIVLLYALVNNNLLPKEVIDKADGIGLNQILLGFAIFIAIKLILKKIEE